MRLVLVDGVGSGANIRQIKQMGGAVDAEWRKKEKKSKKISVVLLNDLVLCR